MVLNSILVEHKSLYVSPPISLAFVKKIRNYKFSFNPEEQCDICYKMDVYVCITIHINSKICTSIYIKQKVSCGGIDAQDISDYIHTRHPMCMFDVVMHSRCRKMYVM